TREEAHARRASSTPKGTAPEKGTSHMPTIDYDRLKRVLTRCGEVAAEPGMKDSVTLVYTDVLKVPAQTYFDVCTTFTNAASAYAKENKESVDALDAFDGTYREARS